MKQWLWLAIVLLRLICSVPQGSHVLDHELCARALSQVLILFPEAALQFPQLFTLSFSKVSTPF